MGLKLTLPKTDNFIGCDFIDAYWSIDNIEFGNYEGNAYVTFNLHTYASREAKYLNQTQVPNTGIPYGGSAEGYYRTILHNWLVQTEAQPLFPDGIPISESEQKDVLYQFVKDYTGLPFEDVFEENN